MQTKSFADIPIDGMKAEDIAHRIMDELIAGHVRTYGDMNKRVSRLTCSVAVELKVRTTDTWRVARSLVE